jgi:DNA replication protein DnaC
MSLEYRYIFLKDKLDAYRSSVKNCEKCSGEGYIPTGKLIDKHTFEYVDCSCRKDFFKIKKYILANIPKRRFGLLREKRIKRTVINQITNKRVSLYKSVIRGYLKNYEKAKKDGLGLMFFGSSGTGKSTGALYILLNLLNSDVDCYYIYFKDLISLLLGTYEDSSKSPLFKEIITVEFLVIDELSLVGRVTPHMVAEFTSICKQRFEEEKPTLLVSNYQTIDEIFHNFGAPLESLLNEAFIAFKFIGRDLREDKWNYMKEFFE